MPWFWWLGVLVLALLAIVLLIAILVAIREVKAEHTNGIQHYRCCEHCGINYPGFDESICAFARNQHETPCNEPGFCTGKELV